MTPLVTLDFPKSAKYGDAERQAVLRVLASGHLSDTGRGEEIRAVEDSFKRLTGAEHALSFNSGTAAIHAALHAAHVRSDCGVAMAPLTWISAITAAFHAGSFPVFCDIQADSWAIDPSQANTIDCSAVLVTHTYGIPAPMDQYRRDVPVVEDCSHAHSAIYANRPVGAWGTAGCFSLQDTKSVSGGEGGMLTTTNRRIYERAMLLGHHPHRLQAEIRGSDLIPLAATGAAHKFRMPPLAAAIATVQMQRLAQRAAAAQANLDIATQVWENHGIPLSLPKLAAGSSRGWYGTPLLIEKNIGDLDSLIDACIGAKIPLRHMYDDWLSSPLLQSPQAVRRFWPHITDWKPPNPADFPHYLRARKRTLILKVPTVEAADYMQQVAHALAHLLIRA